MTLFRLPALTPADDTTAESSEARMRDAARLSPDELQLCARLWQAFAAGEIGLICSVDERRADTDVLGIAAVVEALQRLLPPWVNGVRHLSSFDRDLLSALSDREWRRPIDLIPVLESLIDYVSIETWFDRLVDWVICCRAHPVIEVAFTSEVSRWARYRLRLTALGKALVEDEEVTLPAFPEYWIGGAEVYSGRTTA
jgi:hypothetical protein